MKQLAGQESEKAYNPCRILNISRFGKQKSLEFLLDFNNFEVHRAKGYGIPLIFAIYSVFKSQQTAPQIF